MDSSTSLPVVEVAFNVLAPEGGFMRSFRSLDTGVRKFIDLNIQNLEGTEHWLRVYPDSDESVIDDKSRPGVYLITRAWGIYVTESGDEEIPGRSTIQVRAEINTEVRIDGMPAGTLWVRDYRIDTQRIGA